MKINVGLHINIKNCSRYFFSIFYVVVFLFFGKSLHSQVNNEVFERINTKEGLPQSTVNYIIQDKKGFMWFATFGGICRYDGLTFKVYKHDKNNKNSLSNNVATFLFEDSNGYIWIANGFNQGLDRFDPVSESFVNFKNNPDDSTSISSNEVYSVSQDKTGNIWICTSNALNLFSTQKQGDKTNAHFKRFYNKFSNSVFRLVYEDRNGNLLIFSDYLYKLNRESGEIIKTPLFLPYISYGKLSVSEDKTGNLWLGHLADGLVKLVYDNETHNYSSVKLGILEGVTTNEVIIDHKDRVWIGSENKGLFLYDQKTGLLHKFVNDKTEASTISDNNVVSLFADRSGILWIGTYTQGLCKYNLHKKEFYYYKSIPDDINTLSGNAVSSIHSSVPDELWVGVDFGGGINRFVFDNDKLVQVLHYKHDPKNKNSVSDDRVLCLVQRKNGEVWAGSAGGKVTRIKPHKPENKGKAEIINYDIVTWTFCIFEDSEGVLWGGTWGEGLWRFDDKTDKLIAYKTDPNNSSSLCDKIVWAISEDSQGNIWLGGRDKGLSILPFDQKFSESPKFINYSNCEEKPKSISNNTIQAIFKDSEGTMWVGTSNGLNKVLGNVYTKDKKANENIEFITYHLKDGLPNEIITGILEDNKNNLWIGTTNGLSKFNVKEKYFTNYSESDGLQSNEFTHNAYFKDRKGKMYFGGFNGFNVFYPDSIRPNPFLPKVVFTDIKLFNTSVKIGEKINGDVIISKSVSDLKEIELSDKNKVFSLIFAALHYAQTEKIQYAYKLEGFDKDWNYVGNKREATYTNLNSGKYVFKVKASTGDGTWNDQFSSLVIKILPPWWLIWWAKIIYVVLAFMALYFFRKYTLISANVKHRLMLEHIEKEKSEELNRMRIQFFTDMSHELRTPLSLILAPLETIISSASKLEIKNQLKLIYSNAERLYRLVNDLMDFSKIEGSKLEIRVQNGDIVKFTKNVTESFNELAISNQIDYSFSANNEEIFSWFDNDKLERIIINLLSNAFKFTPKSGKISVLVELVTSERINLLADNTNIGVGYVCISVIDNGSGIEPDHINKIFDRFYQLPTQECSNLKGTGIGLALTKSLVELHRGLITVKSDPNEETVFSVFLPLGKNHFEPGEILETSLKPEIEKQLSGNQIPIDDGVVADKVKPKIIVVEDNQELRDYLVSSLRNNYIVMSSENGRLGYDKIVKHVPDLVISDILMPEISGIELCAKIKANISISHIPVVLLTAKATIDDKVVGLDTGADAYVTKPFNLRHLESVVRNLIESRKKLYQRFSQDVYMLPKEITGNPADQDFLEKAIKYVHENITNPDLSVDDLANHLSMSQRNAYRKIKALTNQTINDFIRITRMKMAIKLMEERRMNISEIAYEVGFSSPAYFTKCFREQFGKSPSAFLSEKSTELETINEA